MTMGMELRSDDGRAVALFDLDGEWSLRFARPGGEKTAFRLTDIAMNALVRLYIEAHKADTAFIEAGVVRFGRSA